MRSLKTNSDETNLFHVNTLPLIGIRARMLYFRTSLCYDYTRKMFTKMVYALLERSKIFLTLFSVRQVLTYK